MTEPTDNVPPEPPAEGTDNVDKPDGGDTSPDIPTLIKDADAQQLKELIEYLNNSGEVGTGDPKDLPFFNSKRNPKDFKYIPRKGIGIEKDGNKYHGFTFDCERKAYSQSKFGESIEEDKKSGNKRALQATLLSAFKDLISSPDHASDMQSYNYLCRQAVYALSLTMNDLLKEKDLHDDGPIALSLVTERLATVSDKELFFKRAVLVRSQVYSGQVQQTNEEHLQDLFAAYTPSVQTDAMLKNNGILGASSPWVTQFVQQAPSVDHIVQMDFQDLNELIKGASAREKDVVHRMYAGMVGKTEYAVAPPIRRNMIENGLDLYVASALEATGKNDLSNVDDRSAYRLYDEVKEFADQLETSDFKAQLQTWFVEDNRQRQQTLQKSFNDGIQGSRQDSLKELSYQDNVAAKFRDKNNAKPPLIDGKPPPKSLEDFMKENPNPNVPAPKSIGDFMKGNPNPKVRAENTFQNIPSSTVTPKLSVANGVGSMLSGGLGGIGGSGLLGALGGPAGAALAAAPILLQSLPMLMELAQFNSNEVTKQISARNEDRQAIEKELRSLVSSLAIDTDQDAEAMQGKVQSLLHKVQTPSDFGLSTLQGLALTQELESLSSNINPNGVQLISLKPYETDVELVAGISGGTALCSVKIFLSKDKIISPAPRSLLKQPKFVRLNGSTMAFTTKTNKTTSDKEARDFEESVIGSSFSLAKKTRNSSNSSVKAKLKGLFLSGEGGEDLGNEASKEKKDNYSNDDQFLTDSKISTMYATITEYVFMPMKTFNLVIAGLIFSDYAFFRIQQINSFSKAVDWMKEFGSHVPLGPQTVGGIFSRKMTMTSLKETKLTTLYSAGMSILSKTSSSGSSRKTDWGGSAGMPFSGVSASGSHKNQSATVSGETKINTNATGNANSNNQINASYECTVTSHGPNATTMADFYQQLSTNNATWTIIDRGEPESYVAVWELLDYIGQGVTLVEVRSHLKAAWEYLAIHNSDQEGLDDELLELLIQNVEGKKNVYKFFNSIISCLVSKKGIIDKDVCTQFEDVMKKAIESQKNSFASSPKNFIENGYELLKKDEKNDELVLLFNLDENCTSYFEANNQLAKMSLSDLEDFTYNFDEAKEKIAEKDTARHLLATCKDYVQDKGLFEYIKSFVIYEDKSNSASKEKFESRLRGKLLYVEERKCCLHIAIDSQDLELIKTIYHACPEAYIKVKNYLEVDLANSGLIEIKDFFDDMEERIEKVHKFVELVATCVVKKGDLRYDYQVVNQLKSVVANGAKKNVGGNARTLFKFLNDGFGAVKRIFEVFNDSVGLVGTSTSARSLYVEAEELLQEMDEWENGWSKIKINFVSAESIIRKKGRVNHLVDLCRKCRVEYENWNLFKKFLGSNVREFKEKDVVEGKLCLHYVIPTKDFDLIKLVYDGYPGARFITDDTDKKTPLEFANDFTPEEMQNLHDIVPSPQEPSATVILDLDFSTMSSFPSEHVAYNGASISDKAPQGVEKALGLNNHVKGSNFERAKVSQFYPHQYVKLNLSKAVSDMSKCSIVFEIYFISQPQFFVDDKLMSKTLIFSEGGSDPSKSRALYMNNEGEFKLEDPGVAGSFDYDSQYEEQREWLHVCVTFDGKHSEMFRDGQKISTYNNTSANYPCADSGSIYFGGIPGVDKFGCDCWIKSVKIYEDELTQGNISFLSSEFHRSILLNSKQVENDSTARSLERSARDEEAAVRDAHDAVKKLVVKYPKTIRERSEALSLILNNATISAQKAMDVSILNAQSHLDTSIKASEAEREEEIINEEKKYNDDTTALIRNRDEYFSFLHTINSQRMEIGYIYNGGDGPISYFDGLPWRRGNYYSFDKIMFERLNIAYQALMIYGKPPNILYVAPGLRTRLIEAYENKKAELTNAIHARTRNKTNEQLEKDHQTRVANYQETFENEKRNATTLYSSTLEGAKSDFENGVQATKDEAYEEIEEAENNALAMTNEFEKNEIGDLLPPIAPQIKFISATQSSTKSQYTADKAIDGITDGRGNNFSHTNDSISGALINPLINPWWEGQLERLAMITKISVYNAGFYQDRINGFYLKIYRDGEEEKVFQFQDASDTVEDRYDIYPNIAGSKVKISLSGTNRVLCLNEVEVFGYVLDSTLLDPIAPQIKFSSATQSSTYVQSSTADKAIDGNTDSSTHNVISHTGTTASGKTDPWWDGQLERLAIITKISVYNRVNNGVPSDRIKGFYLKIYRDGEEEKVFQFQDASDTEEDRYDIYPNIAGSKLKIGLSGTNRILELAEVEVFGYTLQE